MIENLFILLFIFGVTLYYLSTRQSDIDISNTYQVQITFISLATWVIIAYSSFNIQIYSSDLSTSIQIIDYGYVGLSIGFFFLSFLNLIILGIYGSWNMLFKTLKQNMGR